jgi:hypothetical protein
MKNIVWALVAVAVVGGGIFTLSNSPDTNHSETETTQAPNAAADKSPAPSVTNNAAAAHLNAYFDALRAEFPAGANATANIQNVMDGGTKIAQSFFPSNQGPLTRSLVQSLTQFATLSPESWEFKSTNETADTTEVVVNFVVGNASMAKLGMGNSEARYKMQGSGTNWTLLSAEANLQR